MKKILNLTQHPSSVEQRKNGVVDLKGGALAEIRELLTFETLPTREEVVDKARTLASIANQKGAKAALIGGAPYLMAQLEYELLLLEMTPLYAFSTRVSAEKVVDGKTIKTNEFRHLGFVQGSDVINTEINRLRYS